MRTILSAFVILCSLSTLQAETTKKSPFSFAVVSDPHAVEPARWKPDKYGSHVDRFLRCVEVMDAMDGVARPDFILVTGDIHLWALKAHLAAIPFPFHVIAGNHESGAKRQEIRETFPGDFQRDGKPSDYYAFVHKGVRFIGVCDAGPGGDHIGHLTSEDIRPREQCEWLEDQLGKQEKQKVVFAHIPPHPAGQDQNMYLGRNDSLFMCDLVKRTRPSVMFFGHLHQATREYMIGETRCFNVRSCAWNSGEAPLGFLLVTVYPYPSRIDVREILTSEAANGPEPSSSL